MANIKQIYELEKDNTSSIYLFKEGLFLRAYETSAMLFVEHVQTFKVLKKHYKNIDKEIVYLGFPLINLGRIIENKQLPSLVQTENFYVFNGFSTQLNFQVWKDSFRVKTEAEIADKLLYEVDEERMDKHPKTKGKAPLHIYKSGFDILFQIYISTSNFKREYKFTVGEKLKEDAFDLALSCYRLSQGKNKEIHRQAIIDTSDVIRLRLRLLMDLEQISLRCFAHLNTLIEYLLNQLSYKS